MAKSLFDRLAGHVAKNDKLWIANALFGAMGFDPDEEGRKKNAQYRNALLAAGGLDQQGQPTGTRFGQPAGQPLEPGQEREVMGQGWSQTSPEQDHLVNKARHMEYLSGVNPGLGAEFAMQSFDPTQMRERGSMQDYRAAQTQKLRASAAGGGGAPTQVQQNIESYMNLPDDAPEEERRAWQNHLFGKDPAALKIVKAADIMRKDGKHDLAKTLEGTLLNRPIVTDSGGGGKVRVDVHGDVHPVVDSEDATRANARAASEKWKSQDRAEWAAKLPGLRHDLVAASDLVGDLINHKGFNGGIGYGVYDPQRILPDNDISDFRADLQRAKGRIYAIAYEKLKGGGHITEFEAQSIANGLLNLDASQSPEQFIKNVRQFQELMDNYVKIAAMRAGGLQQTPEYALAILRADKLSPIEEGGHEFGGGGGGQETAANPYSAPQDPASALAGERPIAPSATRPAASGVTSDQVRRRWNPETGRVE